MEMTLADHAEAWQKEQGKEVPPRGTKQWRKMYETWVEWAFSDLTSPTPTEPPKGQQ